MHVFALHIEHIKIHHIKYNRLTTHLMVEKYYFYVLYKVFGYMGEEIMSAITGIYHLNKEPISREHGLGMMKALQKYPADDVQNWRKENIFLGCHAQWNTPESVGEQQPYYDYER